MPDLLAPHDGGSPGIALSGGGPPSAVQVRSALQELGYVIRGVTRMAGGSTVPTWRVETPEQVVAVRLYPLGQAAEVWRMVRLLAFLEAGQLPVAGVVTCREVPDWLVLVQTWMPGVSCLDAVQQKSADAWALGLQLGQVHARLHALTLSSDLVLPPLETGQPSGRAVCLHLEYHPLNVLVQGGLVSAVLDWENLRVGDARADVARTLSLLSVAPAVWRAPRELRDLQLLRRGYLAGYTAGGGTVEALPAFLAWAGGFLAEDLGFRTAPADVSRVQRWARSWRTRDAD